jgi:hypothetical protein
MDYLDCLERLDPSRTLLKPRTNRTLLWTGQSSWHRAGLFPDQIETLLAIAGDDAILTGFPFHADFAEHSHSPLPLASLRNMRQSLWCLHNARYRRILSEVLAAAFANTGRRLTLLAASCGFEMLNAAFGGAAPRPGLAVRIVALGPTCLAPIRLPHFVTIQGKRDIYSKLLYRGPVHHTPDCAHLQYHRSSETLQLLKRLTSS